MSYDLKPQRPTEDAPHDNCNQPQWGRYNISGWTWIRNFLTNHGVDVSEFSGYNDGELIKADTCRLVADTIEKHIHELPENEQQWLRPHIQLWRTCGGYRIH